MSCCGCASRVLKLQSEVRSWKAKLADEKREKRMILKWIQAVFGYEVNVEIDKETFGVRVQATENKDAVQKALIKLGLGNGEGDFGMMVMELKLESSEFYEPFEEPCDKEFPILEINSMPSSSQAYLNPMLQPFGHLSSQSLGAQSLSITTPMEVGSTVNAASDQEVLYIGSIEDGTTLEGPNGQSYIIVKSSESDDVPMQLEYSNIIGEEVVSDGNLYYRLANSNESSQRNLPGQLNSSNLVTATQDHANFFNTDTELDLKVSSVVSMSPIKSPTKKKHNVSSKSFSYSQTSLPVKSSSQKKQKSPEINSRQKTTTVNSSMFSSKLANSSSKSKTQSQTESLKGQNSKSLVKQMETHNYSSKKEAAAEFGLTLREKAEIYVMQKAKEAVEKIGNGFRCSVCEENRYTYTNFETAVAHTKTHFESKPYKCEYCEELFSIQRDLLTHRKTVHPKPKGNVTSISSRLTNAQPNYKQSAVQSSNVQIQGISGSSIPITQAKTIIVQAPFDKSLMSGSISISSDVLAALLGSNSAVVSLSTAVTDESKILTVPATNTASTAIVATVSKNNGGSKFRNAK